MMIRIPNQLHASLYMEKGFDSEKCKGKTSDCKSAKNKKTQKRKDGVQTAAKI